MKKRLIETKDLPLSLWDKVNKSICLPEELIDLWKMLLKQNKLEELAQKKAPKGFEGGISKEDTDKHLAWRYNGSCGRVMLSMLDPKQKLKDISDTYATVFSGNKVFLADLPSGSGAATISILCTLVSLRKSNILPRIPLNIIIVAGEISETARSYFSQQLDKLLAILSEQAIWVEYEVVGWDVLDPISTTDLIKKMTIHSKDCSSKILVLSNFTGFLEKESKWKDAKKQLDEIFRYSRGTLSTAIWVEPQKNNVNNFVHRSIKWFLNIFKSLLQIDHKNENLDEWFATTSSKCKQPIKASYFIVRLTVMHFDLPLTKKYD